jgi:hypothetical protein
MTVSRFLQRRIEDKREDQEGGPSFGSKGPRRLGVAVNDLIYGGGYFNFLFDFFSGFQISRVVHPTIRCRVGIFQAHTCLFPPFLSFFFFPSD